MAKEILAVSARPRNYNVGIYSLILANLKKYYAMPDGAQYNIYPELDTLVGLGFTAAMSEGTHRQACKSRVDSFVRYRDFILHKGKLSEIAVIIAEIIQYAMYAFNKLDFPRYYDDFVWALHKTLRSHHGTPEEIRKKNQRIIAMLFEQF